MILLEGVCQRNIAVASAAQVTGYTPHAIAPEHALTTKQEAGKDTDPGRAMGGSAEAASPDRC
jgi:hypothetical protein